MNIQHFGKIVSTIILITAAGCAQVPKESVELSATVGRDLTTSYKAHKELAKVLFGRMKSDVNRFVDNVYAPYQIRVTLENDAVASKAADPKVRSTSLLLGITNAYASGASDQTLKAAITGMGYLVEEIRADIESKRVELLKPVEEQELELASAIDRNYSQIIYANSIVTGYLGSVARVHDAQSEVLRAIGVDGNLPEVIGKRLAATSDKIGTLVAKAEKIEATASSIKSNIADLKSAVITK